MVHAYKYIVNSKKGLKNRTVDTNLFYNSLTMIIESILKLFEIMKINKWDFCENIMFKKRREIKDSISTFMFFKYELLFFCNSRHSGNV